MLTHFRAARRAVLFLAVAAASLSAADVRVYVQYGANQKAAAQAALAQARAREHHAFDDLNTIVATLPEPARAALQRNPIVALVEDDPVRGFLAQSVPYGITMVQAPTAVSSGATGFGIKIGVIDSGVYRAHDDFSGVTLTGEPDYGSGDERTWYRDILSHGTHVVGTLAAADNTVGVIGTSPGTVAIHMVKVFGDSGNWVYSSDLLSAVRAAAAAGCKIVSMSLGGSRASSTEDRGMKDVYAKGVLLVAAAGNDGSTAVSYPAGYASVVSVAAIDASKTVAWFSQRNSDVELAAPGVNVLSTVSYSDPNYPTVSDSGYDYFSGTSMATPHVAGVAGLIWSKHLTATNQQVRDALNATAEDLGTAGRDTAYGYGLVRAQAALDALAAAVGGGGGTSGDTTAPVISGVGSRVTNRNGTFEITWTTNEPATSDVRLNGTLFPDSTLTTTHKRSFRGSKGASYTYYVISADAAGNSASAGPFTHQN